ncbi:adenylate/guanylate cyclase domain-containing protein [Candidatus Uabimicrobium sp. HlEnr_7]|uniref:adenylate/guanylate cyclase domain-containing protein n=1 Tax=Candidatus Uabimicrobium helgolandensis TaxID=3095367 RepID=UPI0035560B05
MFTILCPSCKTSNQAQDHQKSITCESCKTKVPLESPETYSPRLLIIQGANKGKEFVIGNENSIGRGNQNTIKIMEPKASRQHATITFLDGCYRVADLHSGNGTFVNGAAIASVEVNDKDLIRIGDATLMFRNQYSYSPINTEGNEAPKAVLGQKSAYELTKAELNYNTQHSFMMSQENFNSIIEVEKANKKLRIIYEVNNAIGSILPLEEVLSLILDTVFQYIPAQRGAILMYNEKDDPPLQTAVTKVANSEEQKTIHISNTLMDRVIKERKSVLTMDTMLDENLKTAASVMGQIRSAMSVPLITRDKLLGVLHIDTSKKSSSFNEDTLELLTGIVGQAAIAIENAKLIKDIERETETRGHIQRYLSPDLVERVVNGQIDLDMGGKVKKATILFTDLRGFTSMTENIGAEAVVSILNDYFTRMVDIIFGRKGTLDKFMGDAIMGIWGLPIFHQEDPGLAVQAAIEMQNELFYFNMSQRKTGKSTLKMGAGINTGDVVVGNMGSPKRMEYTVIGPDVNLASRVEHLTSRNHVLISENTYSETKDIVKCVELEPTKVKGIDQPIRIFGVVGIEMDDFLCKFIPVLVNNPDGEGKLEGLIDIFNLNNWVLHMEPCDSIDENSELQISIDMPKIIPDSLITLKVNQCVFEKHNDRDEYIEICGEVVSLPEDVKQFFEDVLGMNDEK